MEMIEIKYSLNKQIFAKKLKLKWVRKGKELTRKKKEKKQPQRKTA